MILLRMRVRELLREDGGTSRRFVKIPKKVPFLRKYLIIYTDNFVTIYVDTSYVIIEVVKSNKPIEEGSFCFARMASMAAILEL